MYLLASNIGVSSLPSTSSHSDVGTLSENFSMTLLYAEGVVKSSNEYIPFKSFSKSEKLSDISWRDLNAKYSCPRSANALLFESEQNAKKFSSPLSAE